jgi:hypothetical protein
MGEHGRYSAETIAARREASELIRAMRGIVGEVE